MRLRCSPSKVLLKKTVADIRRRTAEAGRDPSKVLIFNLQTVILGETDAKAKAKFEEYKSWVSYEGAMALISGWTGIDFSQFKPDEPLRHVHTNAIQSAVETFSTADPNTIWTPQALAGGSASVASARCLSAARKPWPICCRSGLKKQTSTGSTWRTR